MTLQYTWSGMVRRSTPLKKAARWGRQPEAYQENPRLAAYRGLCRVAQGKRRPKTCPYPAAKSKAQVYWARARLNEISQTGGSTHKEIDKLIALATTPLRDVPDKAGYDDEALYQRKANGHYARTSRSRG